MSRPASVASIPVKARDQATKARSRLVEPDLLEMMLEVRMHPQVLHVFGVVQIERAPEWLDEDARILEDGFDVLHQLLALCRIGHGQRFAELLVEFRVAVAGLVPRLSRAVGERQHLDAEGTMP